jgi:hypothetical protein
MEAIRTPRQRLRTALNMRQKGSAEWISGS